MDQESPYAVTLRRVHAIGQMVLTLDLDAFLAAIDKAETLGPFVDPTLYREFLWNPKAQAHLEGTRKMAKALQVVKTEAEILRLLGDVQERPLSG